MPEYTFDDRGLPTLAVKWDGTVPKVPKFPVHDSGRRARGELEAICDMICKRWMVEKEYRDGSCTAEWLAHEATRYDGKPTTSAATARVLCRWEEVGYAKMAQKPIRFVHLTSDGVNLGRAELYRRQKRAKRKWRAAVRRGEKPPIV